MYENPMQKATPCGTVIILNGPSGAGKSSIQKAFQSLMLPDIWLRVGIDNLFDIVLPEITLENLDDWRSGNAVRWIDTAQDTQGNKVIFLHIGPEGHKTAFAMNNAIVAYARSGCNVIVDYIAYDHAWLLDLKAKTAELKAYFIAVHTPLEELEHREALRGTSPVGHARSHYTTVHGDIRYDLVVDSGKKSPQEIASKIKKLMY